MKLSLAALLVFVTMACHSSSHPLPENFLSSKSNVDTVPAARDYDHSGWTELTTNDHLLIDIRYATTNNFVHEAVYPCARCFLKPDAAKAIRIVNDRLHKKGYQLIMFDCYRPRPVQQKLWDKVPNPDYVADPAKGSMHNRGTAVDLSIADLNGKEIDMGTPYDFFGEKAHSDCVTLPKNILDLRTMLKSEMEATGFQAIRTEWWHYSLKGILPELSEWQWSCKE